MRLLSIAPLVFAAAAALTGCFTVHAHVPEDVVRLHLAQEEEVDIPAICSYEGERYSQGAVTCMAKKRMTCDASGRWMQEGDCGGPR